MCSKKIKHTVVRIMISLSLLLTPVIVEGQISVPEKQWFYQPPLKVPSQYPKIQSAIDAAKNGQTVLVAPGTYAEKIDFKGKKITVRSSNGAYVTFIDGQWNGSVVTFSGGENNNSILQGFTIRHGKATNGGGIYCASQTSPKIMNCIVKDNVARDDDLLTGGRGGGIYCGEESNPQITSTTITGNWTEEDNAVETTDGGGGIYCYKSNPTIINCTIKGDSTCYGNGGGIACYFSSPWIENCKIEENRALYMYSYGGGIWCQQSNPMIKDCTIKNNKAEMGGYNFGGGIFCYKGNPTIINDTISENTVGYGSYNPCRGGGIHCRYSNPTISDCTFSNNECQHLDGDGGAIYCWYSSPSISNCTFSSNKAGLGGGAFAGFWSTSLITDCKFQYNTAKHGGGVLFEYEGPTIVNCEFRKNSADIDGGEGGAIYGHEDTTKIVNCILYDNKAHKGGGMYFERGNQTVTACTLGWNIAGSADNAGYGGGICFGRTNNWQKNRPLISRSVILQNVSNNCGEGYGAGIFCDSCAPIIVNCEILLNNFGLGSYYNTCGGGVYCDYFSYASFVNCLIAWNEADSGAALYCSYMSTARVINTTVAGNTAYKDAGGFYCNNYGKVVQIINSILWNDVPNEILQGPQGNVSVCYSDIQGGWSGTGNINQNPLFVDPDDLDYSLSPGSPCRDKANNDSIPPDFADLDADGNLTEKTPLDLADNPRISKSIVDMGAYEYQVRSSTNFEDPDDDSGIFGVEGYGLSELSFGLAQNMPNPCNRNKGTTISYSIPHASHVTLSIYNSVGQCVRILVNGTQENGIYSAVWKGEDDVGKQLPNGLYFYKIQAGEFSDIKKLTLLR